MAKRIQYCPKCGKIAIIESHVDVYYCPECNLWIGKRCNCKPDDDCPYSLDKIPDFKTPSDLINWFGNDKKGLK